jgi:imidazolonepropionase-like amidohydrolase
VRRPILPLIAAMLVLTQTMGQAADSGQTLAIRAGRVMTITGGIIEDGVIIVRDGKIDAVGVGLDVPDGARTIDANDRVIVPGFIDAHCHLGLSLDPSDEMDETVHPVTADMRIIDAFEPTTLELIRTIQAGVTTVMLAPGGRNPIGGQTAVVKLSDGNSDRWLVKQSAGVELSFTDEALMPDRRPTSLPGLMALIQEHLDAAEQGRSAEFDPSAEVLAQLKQRKLPAYIRARTVDEISAALSVVDQYHLTAVLVGAWQADEIAGSLVERKLPVIYESLLLHNRDHDLRRVGRLAGAGVKIAFASFCPGRSVSDIRLSAILAVRYGLRREEALRALTVNAAELLGVAGRVGSIQKGRDADLVVFDGDPLEPSSRVEMVLIDGNIVYQREQM